MSRRTRRHAARRAARRAAAPRRLLLGALGAAGAIVLGVLAGGGTFALWTVAAPAASAVTLQAGSAGLTSTPLQLSATNLYPGRTVYAATTVSNTGTTPLALTIDPVTSTAAAPFTTAVAVIVGKTSSAADCTAGRVPATVTTTVGAAGSDLQLTLAPGASQLVCIGVGLPQNAPAAAAGAAASTLTITISGTQVRR
ncbi:hypothetical protein J2X85_002087 [Microbacterium trichothecenolyticum]|uniref:hypothetical protein n=1 Tax=Microbacterium trichothecenolyticum TaxID=69370 RepID=UPI00285B5CE8|nr:hypothetical protein [Microbacterium trichothecenolyticum]MDR7185053.1 hypothetical protein [Microbacterium trichothecenolyticum]